MLVRQGIKTIKDLKQLTDDDAKKIEGIGWKVLTKFRQEAHQASSDTPPPFIDHRRASNPYQSRYGNEWEAKLKNSAALSKFTVISDYIDHIFCESKKVMRGTKHQDDWMVYHDALSLMTAKESKDYMREKDYLKRWILPSHDLFEDSPDLANYKYAKNPPGNSPEFMPWDTHLNKDLHDAHDEHVLLTRQLPDNHPHKFSGSTPNRIASSYQRLIMLNPKPDRIIRDCKRVIESIQAVYDAKGTIVEGLGDRSGRRKEKKGAGETRRGGARSKKEFVPKQTYLHETVVATKKQMIADSVRRHDSESQTVSEVSTITEIDDDDSEVSDEVPTEVGFEDNVEVVDAMEEHGYIL